LALFNTFSSIPKAPPIRKTICFTLSSESPVKLSVYDIAGREVDLIINQNLQAGLHSYIWNAGNFSSGVYYFRLVSGDFSETKQMNLVK